MSNTENLPIVGSAVDLPIRDVGNKIPWLASHVAEGESEDGKRKVRVSQGSRGIYIDISEEDKETRRYAVALYDLVQAVVDCDARLHS